MGFREEVSEGRHDLSFRNQAGNATKKKNSCAREPTQHKKIWGGMGLGGGGSELGARVFVEIRKCPRL